MRWRVQCAGVRGRGKRKKERKKIRDPRVCERLLPPLRNLNTAAGKTRSTGASPPPVCPHRAEIERGGGSEEKEEGWGGMDEDGTRTPEQVRVRVRMEVRARARRLSCVTKNESGLFFYLIVSHRGRAHTHASLRLLPCCLFLFPVRPKKKKKSFVDKNNS